MLKTGLTSATAIGLLTACATAQEAQTPGWLEKDFVELTDQFEGRWDNDRHVFFQRRDVIVAVVVVPRWNDLLWNNLLWNNLLWNVSPFRPANFAG